MKGANYWLDKLRGKQPQAEPPKPKKNGPLYAEKVLIGYETPRVSLKHAVMYREVDALRENGYYSKPITRDSEGYHIGVVYQRIYATMAGMRAAFEELKQEGWVLEESTMHPQAKLILDGTLNDR